jgi:Biotin carboxylase, N-terminal domain
LAVCLAGTTGYLDAEQLIAAARAAGADASHPGFAFLSENAQLFLSENANFAAAVAEAGLTWIGPRVAAVAAMGHGWQPQAGTVRRFEVPGTAVQFGPLERAGGRLDTGIVDGNHHVIHTLHLRRRHSVRPRGQRLRGSADGSSGDDHLGEPGATLYV